MSNRVDLTDRAIAGGWTLPEGWRVFADAEDDLYGEAPDEWADCYTPAQVEAWRRGDWGYVSVSVWVQDATGREWGHDALGMVEAGSFTSTDEDDTVTGVVWIDPLEGEHPIRDHDMIGNALRDAVSALETFGSPVITEPAGDTVTGL